MLCFTLTEVCLCNFGHVAFMVINSFLNVFSDKTDASESLLQALASPTIADPHPINLPPTSHVYKSLLQGGHYNHTSGSVDQIHEPLWDTTTFINQFLKVVGKEAITSMCQGDANGVFVVAELCETLVQGDAADGRQTLKAWFDSDLTKQIEASKAKGNKVHLEKLAPL